MPEALSPNAGRIGKAVEYLISSSCILASDAKLNVSTSLVDDEGVDLVFHLRDHTATLGVQVKARTRGTSLVEKKKIFRAEVRPQTFRPREDLFVLFALVDKKTATLEWVWLVPSILFDEKAPRTGQGKLRFTASINQNTKDQWSGYRFERAELAEEIMRALKRLEKSGR